MDIIDKFDAQIDAYILGSLKGEAKLAFEKELESHQELRNELAMRTSLQHGLEQLEVADIRTRLGKIKQAKKSGSRNNINENGSTANKEVAPVKTTNNWLKYILALAIIGGLLFFASKFFNVDPIEDTPKKMFAEYYEPMPLQLSDRGDVKQEFKDLAELYNAGKYTEVIPLLNGFLAEKPDVKWNLYRGIAYYETGEYVKAEEDFERLALSSNYYLSDHGVWYQALSALKMGDKETAKKLLLSLANKPKADHGKEAKELLSQLDE